MIFVTIDIANLKVTFHATEEEARTFADSQDQFLATSAADLEELTGPQAVALFNATADELDTNIARVKRFSDKQSAAKRLWANLVDLAADRAAREEVQRKLRESAAKLRAKSPAREALSRAVNRAIEEGSPVFVNQPKKAKRQNTGINLAPKATVYPCKEGTKQAMMVDLLSRPEGATMEELIAALSGGNKPWQEVTVKSGLNWDMNKIKGYGIRTTKRGDADCYHLVLPAGLSAPLPHLPRRKKA